MYPWEKEKSSDEEPESQGFPWANGLPQTDDDFEMSPLNEREESAVQLMIQTVREQPWVADPRPPILDYRQEDSQQPLWVPFAAMAAGAACLGGLLVFFLSQPPTPDSSSFRSTVTRTTSTEQREPVIVGSASTPTGASESALLPPTDPEAYLNQQKGTGRDNPFKDTLPVPPLPKPVATARTPGPAKIKPPPPLPPPQPVFNLVSLAVSGSARVAIIQVSNLAPTPSVHEVSPGDQVAGWQVRSVTADRVLLAKGKKTQILLAQ